MSSKKEKTGIVFEASIRIMVAILFVSIFLFFGLSFVTILSSYAPQKIYEIKTQSGIRWCKIASEHYIDSSGRRSKSYLIEYIKKANLKSEYELINEKDIIYIKTPLDLSLVFLSNKEKIIGEITSIEYQDYSINKKNKNFDKLLSKIKEEISKQKYIPIPNNYSFIVRDSAFSDTSKENSEIDIDRFPLNKISGNNSFLVAIKMDNKSNVIMPISYIKNISNPNTMSFLEGIWFSVKGIFDAFLNSESNSGMNKLVPAIFGTVLLVSLMSLLGIPAGVITSLFLSFYVKEGRIKKIFNMLISNLAGVPSIVFGMFGLIFFVYLIGGTIDSFFFSENLPSPTLGTGGILWASATMALLTVPVVIVSTENAIKAIPEEIKMAAYSLGSTKWQLIKRVIIPSATPGILTGFVLSISRGIGEVAPLMILGIARFANNLPIDSSFPFIHVERKFLHISYLVYDQGMLSNNIYETIPMVFVLIFLIILMVVLLKFFEHKLKGIINNKFKI